MLEAARAELLPAWERGSSADVAEAMAKFRDAHESELIAHRQSIAPTPPPSENGAAASPRGCTAPATSRLPMVFSMKASISSNCRRGRAALCCCFCTWRLIATTIVR